MLCGLPLETAAAGGMFLFWRAPRGGLVSIGTILCRDAARPMLGAGEASAERILCRIWGCALGVASEGPRMLVRIVDPICGPVREAGSEPPRIVRFI